MTENQGLGVTPLQLNIFPSYIDNDLDEEYPAFNVEYPACDIRIQRTSISEKVINIASIIFKIIFITAKAAINNLNKLLFLFSYEQSAHLLGADWLINASPHLQEVASYSHMPFFLYPVTQEKISQRIVCWLFSTAIDTCDTLISCIEVKPHAAFDKRINISHLQKGVTIDDSAVPVHIQLQSLITFFKGNNYTDNKIKNYCDLKNEDDSSESELLKNLQTFVDNTSKRTPVLSSPRADQPEELERFYKNVEAWVRLSLYQIENEIAALNLDTPEGKDKEQTLINSRNRLILNLAAAGGKCAMAYRITAEEEHALICNNGTCSKKDFFSLLYDLLADKRSQIINALFVESEFLKKHAQSTETVHVRQSYLEAMSQHIGLPRETGIVDPFAYSFDVQTELDKFCEKYTSDVIIRTIKNAIKEDRLFRDQFNEWASSQRGNWNTLSKEAEKSKLIQVLNDYVTDCNSNQSAIEHRQHLISKQIYLDDSTDDQLLNLIQGNGNAGDFIDQYLAQNQKQEFICALTAACSQLTTPNKHKEEAIREHGITENQPATASAQVSKIELTDTVLEWILVESGILHPQLPSKQQVLLTKEDRGKLFKNLLSNQTELSEELEEIHTWKYTLDQRDDLKSVFMTVNERLPADQATTSNPSWEKTIWVNIPQELSAICQSLFFQVVACLCVLYVSKHFIHRPLQDKISTILTETASQITTASPSHIKTAITTAQHIFQWIQSHSGKLCLIGFTISFSPLMQGHSIITSIACSFLWRNWVLNGDAPNFLKRLASLEESIFKMLILQFALISLTKKICLITGGLIEQTAKNNDAYYRQIDTDDRYKSWIAKLRNDHALSTFVPEGYDAAGVHFSH